MYHFCTYFDSNYLLRGITLYRSLLKCCENSFHFYVLCLDQRTFDVLRSLDERFIVPIRLKDVELWDKELLVAKKNRSLVEYYFTLSPIFPLYVLEHFDVDIVTYLDADLMFFSSPSPIYKELADNSIFITEHGYSEQIKDSEGFGRFNVQCQAFRNDTQGKKCLNRWRKQCLKWCYDRLEDGKFADQKYLDEWPELYGDSLVINQHRGVGVAPWNVKDVPLESVNGDFSIDRIPLVFFHFHGLKILGVHLIRTGLGSYQVALRSELRDLYVTYIQHMRDVKLILDVDGMSRDVRLGHGKLRVLYQGVRLRDLLWL